VVYSAEGFVDRNRNALYTHVQELLQGHGEAARVAAAASSTSSREEQFLVDSGLLLAELFPRNAAEGVHVGVMKGQVGGTETSHDAHSQHHHHHHHHHHESRTVAATFFEQLASLRASLKRADSTFVR